MDGQTNDRWIVGWAKRLTKQWMDKWMDEKNDKKL